MGKTLFDCTYQLARALGVVSEGVATGGSATTIIDTVERTEADDFWNGGTAWILYDAGGLDASPQGKYSFVSDFVQSTGTITLRNTVTDAVASGDRYAVAPLRYPLQLLIQKINETLSVVERVDTTTVEIATDQREYSLPADVLNIKEVYIGSDDVGFDPIYDWEPQKSATGTANKLILSRQFSSGYTAKLVYLTYHAKLQAATDKLDDSIHIDKVVYNAAVGCLLWRLAKVGDSDATVKDLLNYFQAKADRVNQEYAISLPKKSAKTIHPSFNRP